MPTPSTTFLSDTNVLSEVVRRQPDAGVLAWFESQSEIALSAVTVHEVFTGLSWKPRPKVREWFDRFLVSNCQVLPVSVEIARRSGELRGTALSRGQTRSVADSLIAATAQIHGLTLVTRNVRDFEGWGIPLLNPFTRAAEDRLPPGQDIPRERF